MANGEMVAEIIEAAVAQGTVRDLLTFTWVGTTWVNVPDQDPTVVVLTQRAAGATGMPAVCDEVLEATRVSA